MSSDELEKQEDFKQAFMSNFAAMRPDLFMRELYPDNPEGAERAIEQVRKDRIRTSMFANIPMICRGPKCPFAETCPLQKEKNAPIGNSCPLEMAMVADMMQAYMQELGVDPNALNEVSLIRDLVNQEIQYTRANKYLAQEETVQEFCVGTDAAGNPIFNPALHVMTDLEDRLLKRKKDIRNQMVATREAKAKAGQGMIDTAQKLSSIMDNINKWDAEQRKNLQRDADGSLRDAYIAEDSADRGDIVDAEIVEDE